MAAAGGGESMKTGPDDQGQERGQREQGAGGREVTDRDAVVAVKPRLRGDAECTVSAIGHISVLF